MKRKINNNDRITKAIDTLNVNRKINYKDFYLNRYKKYFKTNGNIVKLRKNSTVIDEDIFIPKNLIVKIDPGQKITLINNAFIFQNHLGWLVVKKKKF